MPNEGNGHPILFKISFAHAIAEEIKLLHTQAKEADLGAAYLDAIRTAVFRMRNNPWGFGELIRRMPRSPWSIHIGIVKPLLVEFAIHEEQPIVHVRRVQLLI